MKFIKVLILIAVVFFIQIPGSVLAVSQEIDQTNLAGANFETVLDNTSFKTGQSFKPALNRLTRIDVDLHMLAGPNPNLTLTLSDSSNNAITSIAKNCVDGVNAFTFSSPVEVTVDQEYRFYLQDPSGNYSFKGDSTGTYSRGQAIIGGVLQAGKDFMFRTWGYTIVQSSPSSPAILEPPTDLSASDVLNDEGTAVDLKWQIDSSADIDGYNIYRSEKIENSEPVYVLIDDVSKTSNEYTDEKELDPTKTYLYVVRSFRGVFESEDSNTAEISPTDNIAPNAPKGLKITSSGKGWVELSWEANSEPDLAKYNVKFSRDPGNLDKIEEVDKNQTSLRINHLRRGTDYYFVVVALDTSNNNSISSNRVSTYIPGLNWTWYLWIAIFILFCLSVYAYIAFKKRLWPFKSKKVRKEVEDIVDKIIPDDIMGTNKSEDNMAEAKKIGKITHYFGKIGVGIIKVDDTLSVGDKIKVKGATTDFEQEISSMQVDHKEVKEASKGDEVGVKMDDKVREDDEVFLV